MSESPFQHIRCRVEKGVLTFTIVEREMRGDQLTDDLGQEIFQALEQFQAAKVVVDFREVQYLGSAGIRPLLRLLRRLRDQGGRMVLCNLCAAVEETLRITRLISTSRSYVAPFETAPDEAEALARLSAT